MAKTCTQCQAQASDDAGFCPSCGGALHATAPASQPPPGTSSGQTATIPAPPGDQPAPPSYGGQSVVQGVGVPPYQFNAARWSTADRITGIATLVLLVALFLPWFSASLTYISLSESGVSAHGYLYITLFVSLFLLVYLLARAGWDRLPIATPVAHAPVMLVASALNAVLVVIGFLLKPGGSAVSWSIGAWLALIAAVVAVAPIAIPAIQARRSGP